MSCLLIKMVLVHKTYNCNVSCQLMSQSAEKITFEINHF